MIDIKDLSFAYSKNKKVLNNVNLTIKEGEFTILLGPNGNGKTTLLKCIDNLLSFKQGNISINNKDIKEYRRRDLAKLIGYVPQILEFSDMSVFDTILLGRIPYITFDVSKEDYEIVNNLINKFHLNDIALKNVNDLSGGERQKVAIARLLAGNTKIILFDEPTSNLDVKNQLEAMNLIKEISKEQNITTIVTTHDINLALRYGTNFILMKNGEIASSGDKSIINPQTLKTIFDINVDIVNINNKDIVVYKD